MNSSNYKAKSYSKIYWSIWVVLIIMLLVLRFIFFNVIREHIVGFIGLYGVLSFLLIVIFNFFQKSKYLSYLEKYHYEKWKSLGEPRPWFRNYEMWDFERSSEDLNDSNIRQFKLNN